MIHMVLGVTLGNAKFILSDGYVALIICVVAVTMVGISSAVVALIELIRQGASHGKRHSRRNSR